MVVFVCLCLWSREKASDQTQGVGSGRHVVKASVTLQ